MRSLSRVLTTVIIMLTAVASALAGTLTIQSPAEGAYLGRQNSLRFTLTGSKVDATVTVTLTDPNGGQTILQNRFTPNTDGVVNGSFALNFGDSSPVGDYSATVTVQEPGNAYAPKTVNFKVDTLAPRIDSFTPLNGAYVRDIVKIRAKIVETNLDRWEVRVDNELIPNNTGTTPDVAVDWNAGAISKDGQHNITLTVKDLAGNVTTKSVTVTLDRVKPTVSIAYPRSDTQLYRRQAITVIIDVTDAGANAVDATGIDVLIRGTDGTFRARVARLSVVQSGANSIRWTGRIRAGMILPRDFRIVATARDRAGNIATPQEVAITLR